MKLRLRAYTLAVDFNGFLGGIHCCRSVLSGEEREERNVIKSIKIKKAKLVRLNQVVKMLGKKINVIDPEKCILEDLEILSFKNEQELNYYTVWHDALVEIRNKRSLVNKQSEDRSNSIVHTRAEQRTVGRDNVRNSRRSAPVPLTRYPLPNGLTVLEATIPCGMLKYKLNKIYKKYRGQQRRRAFVMDKQRRNEIDREVSKSYLNSWRAYTALQALRLPESLSANNNNNNNLSTIIVPSSSMMNAVQQQQQQQQPFQVQPNNTISSSSCLSPAPIISNGYNQLFTNQVNGYQTNGGSTSSVPMQLVYLDPSAIISYSNRINPQQVADYRLNSHKYPTPATSKKSSAASYDVIEIMEVLANSTKTNVTITRNAHRPTLRTNHDESDVNFDKQQPIYSHSVNTAIPGIVSTQLHVQARLYCETLARLYADEFQRVSQESSKQAEEPSMEESMSKYLYL